MRSKSKDEPSIGYPHPGEVRFEWADGFRTHYYFNPAIKNLHMKPEFKQMIATAENAHQMFVKYGPE